MLLAKLTETKGSIRCLVSRTSIIALWPLVFVSFWCRKGITKTGVNGSRAAFLLAFIFSVWCGRRGRTREQCKGKGARVGGLLRVFSLVTAKATGSREFGDLGFQPFFPNGNRLSSSDFTACTSFGDMSRFTRAWSLRAYG